MSESGGKKWLAYGCFGCLGIVGLVVLLAAGVTGLGALRARGERIVEKTFSHAAASEPGVADPGAAEATPRDPSGSSLELPPTPGRVILDLRQGGEFHVEPAGEGEPLEVFASYDESTYALTETFEEPEGQGFVYTVIFERNTSGVVTAIKELISGNRPKVEVRLPQGTPFALEVRAQQGGVIMELGGLWLTSADVELDKGGLVLDVGRPLVQPMERLAVRGSMAGLVATSLGNASPRELTIDFSMGGVNLDLDGEWVTDSEIHIKTRMGGGRIDLPRNVRIEGLEDQGIESMKRPEIVPPTLRFTIDGDPDDLKFER